MKHKSTPSITSAILFLYGLLVSTTVSAANITPNEVFQVVDTIYNELKLMHEADESSWESSAYTITKRKPRHVIQKGREVFLRVQDLRQLNGLSVQNVSPFPTIEITPSNVKAIVDDIANDLKELREEYGVEEPYAIAPLPTGKTPNDVYLHLQAVNQVLSGFDLPAVVPNDVYQLAATIVNELTLVRNKKNIISEVESYAPSSNKTPSDVYTLAKEIMGILKNNCSSNTIFCPKGGITIPPTPNGIIKPANVLDILNNILAEIGSIKVNVGIAVTTELAPHPSGKTPSSVFDTLLIVKALASSLK